jgi:hypothetical protein
MQLKRCKQQHLLQRNIDQQRSKTNDHLIITKNMHTTMNFFKMNILNKTMAIIETWSKFCKNSTKHHNFWVFLIKMNIFCKMCFHVEPHNIKGLSYWIIEKIHHILVSMFNRLEYLDDGYLFQFENNLIFFSLKQGNFYLFFHSHVFQSIVPSLTNINVSNPIDESHYTCDNFTIFDDLPKSCTKFCLTCL